MNTSSSTQNSKKEIGFNFNTSYKGNDITLKVLADEDRYTVLHEDKTLGHIKLGDARHTWYVVDSYYPAPGLVNTISSKIQAQYQLAG